jgi:hypothetical protein
VIGAQPVPPQTLGLPVPPHVCGGVHVPQLSVPPHPSPMSPQFAPAFAHVVGVQVGGGGGLSGEMHDARSKSMYSRTFSCAVIGLYVHSSGNDA